MNKSAYVMISVISALLLGLSQSAWSTAYHYVYPAAESDNDHRFDDLVALLSESLLATKAEYGDYVIEPAQQTMNESRYLLELKDSRLLNIIWTSTSVEKETTLRPIRVPLRKGLLGYRISFIAKGTQQKIDSNSQSLEALRALTIGQGRGWGDVELYRYNDFKVMESQYENLFKLTAAGRFDLFPRGVNEVFTEYDVRHAELPALAIEDNLLIYYPWPYYFFTTRTNEYLAARVEKGLLLMIKNGRFDELFQTRHGDTIRKGRLTERRVIKIINPLLPESTPLDDSRLWYDPLAK